MSNRSYLALSAIIATASGLIVVSSFAFNQAAATWIAFGLSVTALTGSVASLVAVPSTGARRYRAVAVVIGAVAAFAIIASVGVFIGGAQHWIEFGAGVGGVTLTALAGGYYVSRLVESQESTGVENSSGMSEPLRAAG